MRFVRLQTLRKWRAKLEGRFIWRLPLIGTQGVQVGGKGGINWSVESSNCWCSRPEHHLSTCRWEEVGQTYLNWLGCLVSVFCFCEGSGFEERAHGGKNYYDGYKLLLVPFTQSTSKWEILLTTWWARGHTSSFKFQDVAPQLASAHGTYRNVKASCQSIKSFRQEEDRNEITRPNAERRNTGLGWIRNPMRP